LASFNVGDGWDPNGGLVISADGSTLYGTTQKGGIYRLGVVFSIPVSGGTPTDLVTFAGYDGEYPCAGLIISGDTLYGTTLISNSGNLCVFSLPISGSAPTILTPQFALSLLQSEAPLVLSGSYLYGTCIGGFSALGTVFSVPITGGSFNVLATFNGTNGSNPVAGLLMYDNTLYGTTEYGGADGDGVAFSVPVTGGTPTVIESFDGLNGADPTCALVADAAGNIYGSTPSGGIYSAGTVFVLFNTNLIANVWTGSESTSWTDPANWSEESVPSDQDNVLIQSASVIASSSINVNSLHLISANLQLAGNGGPSYVNTLTITNGGTLDIANNTLTITYGTGTDPNSTILSYLATGASGGSWNGTGIVSSAAAGNSNYGVAFADGADGIDPSLTTGQIEIAYAQYGDITLQGLVNANDFQILTSNFGDITTAGWEAGDFTYGGTVDAQDFSLLTANFGQTETGEAVSVPAGTSADTITIPDTTSAPVVLSVTPTLATVATDLAVAAPTAPVINGTANRKPKPFAAANYAANVAAVPPAGSTTPLQDIDKDAKFLADR
jgi:uncharacterized repeat protein (TIGR03803 family)